MNNLSSKDKNNRQKREAAALRQNLLKRKQQARNRAQSNELEPALPKTTPQKETIQNKKSASFIHVPEADT